MNMWWVEVKIIGGASIKTDFKSEEGARQWAEGSERPGRIVRVYEGNEDGVPLVLAQPLSSPLPYVVETINKVDTSDIDRIINEAFPIFNGNYEVEAYEEYSRSQWHIIGCSPDDIESWADFDRDDVAEILSEGLKAASYKLSAMMRTLAREGMIEATDYYILTDC